MVLKVQSTGMPSLAKGFETLSPFLSVDVAGRDKPIPDFRPEFWPRLDKQREALSIDLFWPIKLDKKGDEEQDNEEQDDDEEDKDVFPYAGLEPLVTFHNLRHLQINGMMRSYQPLIFATCWVNKNLTRVHLEMALEPEMKPTSKDTKLKHRLINDKWSPNVFNKKQPGYCEYLGHHGEGVLHEEFGYGEYLDQQAIKVAQLSVGIELPQENLQFLPITHLTLRNFVVDAGPFFRWFDSARLQEIVFLGDCVDAGFYLPPAMKPTIKFTAPKPLNVARWVKPGEIKLVDIKKRKSTPIQGDGDGNSGPALLNNKPSPAMLNSEVNTKDNDNKVAKGKNEEITKDEGKEQENNKQVG